MDKQIGCAVLVGNVYMASAIGGSPLNLFASLALT